MTRFTALFGIALTFIACNASSPTKTEAVKHALTLPFGDVNNVCQVRPTSPVVQLPADDVNHYPGRVPAGKENFQPAAGQFGIPFESTFKYWWWDAIDTLTGEHKRLYAYRAYIVTFLPGGILPGADLPDWYRLYMVGMSSPIDGQMHQYFFVAPGQFVDQYDTNGVGKGYDMQLGADGQWVLDFSTFSMLDPTKLVAKASGAGGVNLKDEFRSPDGQFAFKTTEQEVGRPYFPFVDGAALPQYAPWSYYWARSQLAGIGTATYAGRQYVVASPSWEERQWPGSDRYFHWKWLQLHVVGCKNAAGSTIACAEAGPLGYGGVGAQTVAAFAIDEHATGQKAIYDYTETGALPVCSHFHSLDQNLFSFEPLETYEWNGHVYTTKVRFRAPARGVDVVASAVAPRSETYLVEPFFPGAWVGPVTFEGTINNKRVFGEGHWELFQQ